MGKKKFIDKKHSTTYSLVYRSTETSDDVPERVLVEKDNRIGLPDPGTHSESDDESFAYPSYLAASSSKEPLTLQQRKEIAELGLPDDGYNYLKHLRTFGSGRAGLEGVATGQEGALLYLGRAARASEVVVYGRLRQHLLLHMHAYGAAAAS